MLYMIKNREPGDKKSDSFLHINSCKVQAPFGKEITCHRPKGRLDYQLTYLLNGDFEVVYNGESKRISEGFVLLPPELPESLHRFCRYKANLCAFFGNRC